MGMQPGMACLATPSRVKGVQRKLLVTARTFLVRGEMKVRRRALAGRCSRRLTHTLRELRVAQSWFSQSLLQRVQNCVTKLCI